MSQLHSQFKIYYKVCYKEMKEQQSVIKTVKGANNQRRDNENNRWKKIAKKQKKNRLRQKGARETEAIVKE